MKIILLFASIVIASGLLISNIYTSVVDSTSWGSNIPHSIEAAREYFKTVNPGNFFRIYSPVNQVLALLALAVPALSSRVRAAGRGRRPMPFICALERPG